MRCLPRDGTTRDADRGQLYGAETDVAGGNAFIEPGRGHRHQFRFVIAPEDGDRLADLRGFPRDVMRQMKQNLGTWLEWIVVDHFNTVHPHANVIVH